jgi:hypothetical protein
MHDQEGLPADLRHRSTSRESLFPNEDYESGDEDESVQRLLIS